MSVFAAVDIGANSVRLKVARVVRHRLKTLHEDRVVTRLGESVFRFGVLSPESMDATVQMLRRFHRTVQKLGVDRVRVVATSALRDARNASAFVAWVRSATGWKVETIPGLEEGRLIHLGVMSNSNLAGVRVLLADLGGGSCELTVSDRGHIREMVSLPLGAVRLTNEFLAHDPPHAVEIQRLREDIAEEIDRVRGRIVAAKVATMVATSGTAAAIARAARAAESRSRGGRSVSISQRAVAHLAEELSRMESEERARLPGINARRAEIIIAGAHVYAELMTRCNLPSFRYSSLGLRDGVLAQMLADHDRATRSRRQIDAVREDAVRAMCRRYSVDLKDAQRVRSTATSLFTQLRRVHGLPAEYELWLAAAAMLNEVGNYINRSGRHRHTYYLIARSEILGYSSEQRKVIAAIARYLGKSRPQPGDEPVDALSSVDQEHVPKAVVLLRLAKAMNHRAGGGIQRTVAAIESHRVVLKLESTGGAELELWAMEKERALFREVFGRELVVQLV
jgi:exopolyphosphatase/guanosine-5'-triphosphate,3'-diphosphate pyrophosphatase